MEVPSKFKDMRPFLPEELGEACEQLLNDPQFGEIVAKFMGSNGQGAIRQALHSCKTNLDIQKALFYPLVHKLLDKNSDGFSLEDPHSLDRSRNYTFVSNHRDIVLDSALLSILLLDSGFPSTVQIAIGDNLLVYPWIKTLVRINKSFIVKRQAGMRETLIASKLMSEYMHFVISTMKDNIWIAQREGRAKDSNDRTQESVLKMMAMGGEGSPAESLAQLNIVPLSISYEYDPCDYLKAKEFQQKRDIEGFKKSKQDDLVNMSVGINGYKGRVVYHFCECINSWLDNHADLPKAKLYASLAQEMDRRIHRGYHLFPGNYVAADTLQGGNSFVNMYSEEEKSKFLQYIESRIDLIDLPNKDYGFLRECLLKMYANPAINKTLVMQ